jgi:hypothetical protein
MYAMPPYDRSPARERLTAELQAAGIPSLQEANAFTGERPNIPLSELTDDRIAGLLSVIDQWIENVERTRQNRRSEIEDHQIGGVDGCRLTGDCGILGSRIDCR